MYGTSAVRDVVRQGIADGAFPGAAWAFGTSNHFESGCEGRLSDLTDDPVTVETLWDMASVTKVMATTALAMHLWEKGQLPLDQPVAGFIPSFGQNGKDRITLRNLMLHNSGLPDYIHFHDLGIWKREEILHHLDGAALVSEPGERTGYSCLGYITLTQVLEQITGMRLGAACQELVYEPMGLTGLGFNPASERQPLCAPAEAAPEWRIGLSEGIGLWAGPDGKTYARGRVHDETSFLLGGEGGNAGLFATITAVAGYAQAMLTGSNPISLATVRTFARRQSMASSRGLGWDTKALSGGSSAGTLFGQHSFGHLGFTGTSLWIDPESDCFCALLTNRVHPSRDREGTASVRPRFANACFRSLFPS